VKYLGHIIFSERVAIDLNKAEIVRNLPTPQSVKELRGFVGLIGWYRKFIRNFGVIIILLIKKLKKNIFN
jgi:hypothetical protein